MLNFLILFLIAYSYSLSHNLFFFEILDPFSNNSILSSSLFSTYKLYTQFIFSSFYFPNMELAHSQLDLTQSYLDTSHYSDSSNLLESRLSAQDLGQMEKHNLLHKLL
jgi:hypothetical protein